MCWTTRDLRTGRDTEATLPGPSRTITVEPIEVPAPDQAPVRETDAPPAEPQREAEPAEPLKEPTPA